MTAETVADRRLHPSSIWLAAIRSVTSLAAPAAIFAFVRIVQGGVMGVIKYLPAGLMIVLLSCGLTALFAYLSWSKFRYGIGERDIVIESGVFNRVRRSIPLARVQDVNIEQGPLARLFGLAKVKIETGGGQKDEGLLDSLSLEEADHLRQVIRGTLPAGAALSPETPAATAPHAGHIVYEMTPRRLLIAGLFSFSLFYLAAAFAVIETVGDLLAFDVFDLSTWRDVAQQASFQSVSLLILAVAVLGVVAGAGRTMIRDHGFKLWKEGGKFRRERGLLTKSQVVVSLPRVQLAKMSTGPLRRLFGWYELSLQTLGGAVEDAQGRQSIAPFASRAEIGAILTEAGAFRLPQHETLTRVSSRGLFRKLAPLLVPALIVLTISLFLPFGYLALAGIVLFAIHETFAWLHYRYALEGDLLFVTEGFLRQRLWIAPPSSAQTVTLRRSWLQRLLGLATVIIDTAGSSGVDPLSVKDLREERARELVARLGVLARPASPPRRRRPAPKRKAPPSQ